MSSETLKETLKQRLNELVLEDEVFVSRINKFSSIPGEILKRIEKSITDLVDKFLEGKDLDKIDGDDAYIILSQDIRNLKNQTVNEIRNSNKKEN
ncbi:hypothetical protein J7L48_08295 [bacterium]|nr:hypothetical protein [bacterium]